MQRLWDEERARGSDTLRLETLGELGGARHIVEEHLEGAMAELAPEQKDVAARLFNHLVTPSGTKIAHEVSDLADFGQAPIEVVQPVLATLAERRILRSLEESGGTRYEIFHDVLAQPVLAWRAQHESELELNRERERAQTRQRRLVGALAVGVVALAVMTGVTAYALTQRDEAKKQAASAEASRSEAARQAQLAEAQKALAEERAEEARSARNKAVASEAAAREAEDNAVASEAAAREAQDEAESESAQAEAAESEAEAQAERAQQEAERAKQAEDQAIQSENQAESEAERAKTQEQAAERAKADAEQAAHSASARALAEEALTLLSTRPVESLRLAVEAGERESTPLAERVLRSALTASRVRAVLPGGGGPVTDASFSRDGRRVVTVADRVRVFDARTGSLVRALPDPARVNAASFSPDGGRVATASLDGTARVWPVTGGRPLALLGHSKSVEDASFSRDGGLVATASIDRTARVWSARTGQQLSVLEHDGPVFGVELSPDGKLVATVSRVARTGRRIARLFDSASGQPIRTFDQIGITAAIFSPDGSISRDDEHRRHDSHLGSSRSRRARGSPSA